MDCWSHRDNPHFAILRSAQGELLPSHIHIRPFQFQQLSLPWSHVIGHSQKPPEMGSKCDLESFPFFGSSNPIPFVLRIGLWHMLTFPVYYTIAEEVRSCVR